MPADTLAIICNWNKARDLDRTLTTLRDCGAEPGALDVLVVDNASTDGSVEMVRERHPWARVHVNPENLGGTGGFNAGMRIALEEGYKFFWLMDNDIVIHQGAFAALRRTMDSDRRIGLVGCRVQYLENPEVTQEVGGRVDWQTGRLEQFDKDATNPEPHVNQVDFASACSLFARSGAARAVGIWDPAYFITFDDVDWGVRMNRGGWRVVADSEAVVEHASFFARRPKQGLVTCYYSVRNALYFQRRHNDRFFRRACLMFHIFRRFLGDAALYRRSGEPGLAQALSCAMRDYFGQRMGKCPHTIDFGAQRETFDFPSFKRPRPRLLLIGSASEELIHQYLKVIRERYPEADIQVFINAADVDLLEAEIPGKVIIPFGTLGQRLRYLLKIALRRRDAVFASNVVRPHLFEDLMPWACRLDADGKVTAISRGGLFGLARKAMIRASAACVAIPLAIAGAVWPLGKPNYFTFNDPPLDESASNGHRDQTQSKPKREALTYMKAAVNYAIAFGATALVTPIMAALWRRSKRRGAVK
jgi:GT2 family glycosyltransferase